MEKVIKKKIDEIIRVNHAGEYGAQRIYSGQIKFCKKEDLKKELKRIIKEEYEHYEFFNEEMINRRTRPTLLSPVWHYGGYFLGVFTSIIGEKYVHACTEAVEEVIVEPKPTIFVLTSNVFTLSFSICNLTRLFSTLAVTTPTTLLLNPDLVST